MDDVLSARERKSQPACAGNLNYADSLVSNHLGLARSLAWKYRPWGAQSVHDVDDLEQEASIALMEAAERFDDSKGVKFVTFAYHHIRGRLLKINRVERRHRENISYHPPNESILDDEDTLNPLDCACACTDSAPDVQAHLRDLAGKLYHRIKELPPRRREVMAQLLRGGSVTEVAQKLDVSKARVSTIMRKCRDQFAEEFAV